MHLFVTPARKEGFVRRHPALLTSAAIAIVAAASLTGCTTSAIDACAPVITSGPGSELVTAEGKVGALPKVTFPTTMAAASPERTVLAAGEGAVAELGATVDFDTLVLDAKTGKELLTTAFDGSQGVRYRAGVSSATDQVGSLANALVCAQAGQRVSLVTTAFDSGLDFSSFGMTSDSTVVFVIDVQAVYLGKANGINQIPFDGMPSVVTAVDGTVGITVPKADAPTETRISTIKAGSGAAVADGDTVVLQVASWVWPAEKGAIPSTLQSTWNSVPGSTPVVVDPTGAQGVTPGFHEAVVGATVGSQVLAVVAPADSYAPGAWPAGAGDGATIIYVIDVLGIQDSAE